MSNILSSEVFHTIVNTIDDAVCIFDHNTDEIVWMNELAKKTLQKSTWERKKAIDVLHEKDLPSSFSFKEKLTKDKFHYWQYFSKDTGKHFQIKSKLIQNKDRLLRLGILTDITEHVKQNKSRQNLYDHERALLESFRLLMNKERPHEAFSTALKIAGEQYKADRAFIFQFDESIEGEKQTISCTHEWCAENIPSKRTILQYLPTDRVSFLLDFKDAKNHEFVINHIDSFKVTHKDAYDFFIEHDVNRIHATPIYQNNEFVGVVSVDNAKSTFEDLTLLSTIALFVSIDRHRKERISQLEKTGELDPLTLVGTRDAFMKRKSIIEHNTDKRLGILYADLNNLNVINTTQSRGRGDLFLQSVSGLFLQYFDATEIFRIGNDEFIFLCSGISEALFFKKVHHLVSECDKRFPKKVAFGILWNENPQNIDAMINEVDQLMYEDKEQKKKGSKFP